MIRASGEGILGVFWPLPRGYYLSTQFPQFLSFGKARTGHIAERGCWGYPGSPASHVDYCQTSMLQLHSSIASTSNTKVAVVLNGLG